VSCLLFVVDGLTYVHFEYETQWGNNNDKSQDIVYETPRIFKVPKNETVEVKAAEVRSFSCFSMVSGSSGHAMDQ